MRKDFADHVASKASNRRISRSSAAAAPRSRRKRHGPIRLRLKSLPIKGFLAVATACAVVWILLGSGESSVASIATTHEEWIAAEAVQEAPVQPRWKREVIRRGDAAVNVLQRMGFSRGDVNHILQAAKPVYSLAKVRAGYHFMKRNNTNGIDLYYPVNDEKMLYLTQRDKKWQAKLQSRIEFSRERVFEGKIRDSLFVDAARAGMDDRTTMNLVDIFAWDIDFVRDLRRGDRFRVLTENRYDVEGRMIGSVIRSAEFINQKRVYQAIRYTLANGRTGYYTPEGKSMRKTYLKAPVKFTRISSRFKLRRKHPVLGYTRAHRGVDYAAPSGTSIHAVGDGRILHAGWKGGYGRFVLIRHTNGTHSTAYGHMRRYARGLRKGKRVRQGQVIGYVGMSGLATGPHLHFEFRVHGRAVNPLHIKRTPAIPVPKKEMVRFKQQATKQLRALSDKQTGISWG
ncbi:MAG: peptidoglycan DD-metalloendopeptidase family protein [Mariprofundaceae bacterium]